MTDLVVAEMFGPTIQGEGPFAGRPRTFLRLGRCNLDCAWCDTPYTWDWTRFDPADEMTRYPVDAVAAAVNDRALPVVVTGGEPLLQARGLSQLAGMLTVDVEVETNGTRPPIDAPGWFYVVSPKLASSGATGTRIVPDTLRQFADLAAAGRAAVKFVVSSATDLDEVDGIVAAAGFAPSSVWLMPEGRTDDALSVHLGWLADLAVARGYSLSDRLHVRAWGDRRGR